MIGLLTGVGAGLLAAPVLRAEATRRAVPFGEPPAGCDCAAVRRWLPATGRCPGCGRQSGPGPLTVELVAAAVGAAVGSAAPWPLLPLLAWIALLGVVLGFVDVAVHRLPDALTLRLALGVAVLLPVAALLDHRPGVLLRCLLAAAVLGVVYGALAMLGPMGLGDAKLAPVLGALLAWYGWRTVFSGVFTGFLLGALWGLALLVTRRARARDPIPFGPCMLLGALVAVLAAR
ncbi:leader peptidase (prepilin peptidase)/N-methyltransferase [Kitasatospora sp. MAA4]|uniref:A24 family peptidase n=1 Tax=Kitasatospora sp. MAA4 TaxID=3035093 RepID=UPI0024752AD2|nr:A24 family peptidase [Kitasatospora sp. MAA4]MDH6134975.1 leader peptidase (prepilin peptidase)/N-methyltransferase [Kitasatospora sp. MAA4]